MNEIEKVDLIQKSQAVKILADAFFEYPVMKYILQDADHDYRSHLEALVGFYCETRFTRQWPVLGIQEDDILVAVAGMNPPESVPWPPALHEIYRNLGKTIGPEAIQRMETFENFCEEAEPDFPHYFLGIIGVLPGHQGKGYSRRLMEEIQALSKAHPESRGICLSTELEDNISLYRHLGFEILQEGDIGELHTWIMFRPD